VGEQTASRYYGRKAADISLSLSFIFCRIRRMERRKWGWEGSEEFCGPLVLISIVPVGGGFSSGLRVRKRRKGGGIEVATRFRVVPPVSLHPYYFFLHKRDRGRKPIAKEDEEWAILHMKRRKRKESLLGQIRILEWIGIAFLFLQQKSIYTLSHRVVTYRQW